MPNSKTTSVQSPKRPFHAISHGNPRRSHPSLSKSLPKHKKVKIEHDSDSSVGKRTSSEGLISPNLPQGESRDSSSDQSAAKWFASKNENVADSQNKKHTQEDESPFYLAQQTGFQPPANLRSHNGESFGVRARDETENDELRGVIDDLTVENKKLKHVLRNWQARSSPSDSNPDRLFEVRMHGLPAEKKRELEQLLRKFATDLTGDSPSQPSSTAPIENSSSSPGHTPASGPKARLDPTPADSGYASISHSRLNSRSHSGGGNVRDRDPISKSKKESDIKNYLHDIPDSLLPRENVPVSENAKLQLVVQRLEHLFTGNGATSGDHSLPLQQQQISRSAAKADRREDRKQNRASRVEGSREAHILPPDSKVNLDAVDGSGQRPGNQPGSDRSSMEGTGTDVSGRPCSPEQRPTRPLDLDIHRAQVAADNVDYIRHLGLSSPQFDDRVEVKEQPWMYLNLLVSMAQLHTLNVTPAFVRKAVRQLSTKFELSKDGHKIRWLGAGLQAGSPGQETPAFALHRVSEETADDGGRRSGRSTTSTLNNASASLSDDKVPKAQSSNTSKLVNSVTVSSNPTRAQTSITQPKSASTFDYKPVVFQGKRPFLKAKESYLDSSSSYDDVSPESSDLIHALSRSSLKSKEDAYDGCVTFFNNSYFFTDLSGDKAATTVRASGPRGDRDTLGVHRQQHLPMDDTLRDANACYFLTPRPPERTGWPQDCGQIEISVSPIGSAGEPETQPIELDASGVGGVRPEDNFALDVQVARTRQKLSNVKGKRRFGDRPPAIYSYQVARCRKLGLQPSRLPPPSYVFFTTSSSSEAEKSRYCEDDDSEESSEAEYSPAPAGFLWQWSSSSNDRQAGDDDVSIASSSLGVLEAARARMSHGGPINEMGRNTSGSLAATAGASWSAASNGAEPEINRNLDEESVTSMSVEQEL